jgi:hypothetical protein
MSLSSKPNARTTQESAITTSASLAKTNAVEKLSPPSTLALPESEPRIYTRRAPVGFGDRLANARGLPPQEAPPVPPLRATGPVFSLNGGVSLSSPGLAVLPGVAMRTIPKYGGVKGSYISPYDVGGQPPGNKHLPASSTTVAEFEAKYGSTASRFPPQSADAQEEAASEGSVESDRTIVPLPGRSISFGMMPPVSITGKPNAPIGVMGEEGVIPVSEDVRSIRIYSPSPAVH